MKISTILDHIDSGHWALPEFQRGYVWNRDQVRGLFWTLYRRYPFGSLLVWATGSAGASHRGDQALAAGVVKMLLDGQQRITSIYGVLRGEPPAFFDGDVNAFTGLYFNLQTEEFSFYMPTRMQGNALWVDVSKLMLAGPSSLMQRLFTELEDKESVPQYLERINRLYGVRDIEVHAEEITGADKTIDVVVDIFNRVNSGGTTLSKGDLALAKICSAEPDARHKMRKQLNDWQAAGYQYFKLDWLLRNVNSILNGEANFKALHDVIAEDFVNALFQAVNLTNRLLDLIAARLGLDHGRVLFGYYAFPLLVRYLAQKGKEQLDEKELNALLFWYINSAMWGRYSGSTETVLARDLTIMTHSNGGMEALINELVLWRGSLKILPEHFNSWSKGARFYPVLYMLTRVGEAKDWGLGIPLKKGLLGRNSSLEVHHIFPRALLKKHGYDKTQINAVANFCFLTKDTNLLISDADPAVYFEQIESRHPGALASQWIPMNRELWQVERYPEFLAERRKLLAQAANEFLNSLYQLQNLPEGRSFTTIGERLAPGGIDSADEQAEIDALCEWIANHKLVSGEVEYELIDSVSGEQTATVDLAWPDGIQVGLSQPVALALNEAATTVKRIADAGFRCFESTEELKEYIAVTCLGDMRFGLPAWSDNVEEDFVPVIRHLVKIQAPQPIVGYEVIGETGEIVAEYELAWPDFKVAIARADFLAPMEGWYLLPLAEVLENSYLLDARLGIAG